jgi:hypothetical protein
VTFEFLITGEFCLFRAGGVGPSPGPLLILTPGRDQACSRGEVENMVRMLGMEPRTSK